MTPEQQASMFSSATDMWATPQEFFDKMIETRVTAQEKHQ